MDQITDDDFDKEDGKNSRDVTKGDNNISLDLTETPSRDKI